jgi:hypothetical protein
VARAPIERASYRILGAVGFGIDLRARSTKSRGLFRKGPDPRDIGERVGRLVRRVVSGGVVRAGWSGERYIAELRLHPAAPVATLSVEPDGELRLRAETAPLGPGYHADVIARMAPLLDELDFAWTEPFEAAQTQRAMCEWLAGELRTGTPVRLGIPEQRRFRVADAPALTLAGPRDAAWRDAVLADPMRAADAFPWWDVGPGRAARAKALVSMWLEVPWREPLDGDERELMKQVDEDLRAARKADPALELPWAAWRELLAYLGVDDEDVTARAASEVQAIGYRRHDLEVELSGGWLVTMSGAMVGHWEDDGERYWAPDGERALEFTSLTADGETDSEKLLAVAPEKHPVIAQFSDGAQRGRAEAFDDDDIRVVIGLMARAPHVGILTCKGGDDAWALATWRSLRQLG